jgi:hypothetical protein
VASLGHAVAGDDGVGDGDVGHIEGSDGMQSKRLANARRSWHMLLLYVT